MSNEADATPQEPQQMKKASDLDAGWLKGSSVCSLAGPFEEDKLETLQVESSQPKLEFAWFAVKAKNGNTDQEEREKQVAMQEQVALGIIKPNGLPVGWKENPTDALRAQGADRGMPAPQQAQSQAKPKLPGGKLGRKLLRERDRAIQKDMNRLVREEKLKTKNSLISRLQASENTSTRNGNKK